MRGYDKAAYSALKRVRKFPEIEDELETYKSKEEEKFSISGFAKKIFRVSLIRPIIIAVGLSIAQQLSGVNVIFSYSTRIFLDAGIEIPAVATAVIGLINVFMTVIGV